jgi:hypothetical protein
MIEQGFAYEYTYNLRDEKNPCFLFKSNSTDTWCLRFLAKNRRHQVSPGTVFFKSQILIYYVKI